MKFRSSKTIATQLADQIHDRLESLEDFVQDAFPRRRRSIATTAGWVTAGVAAVSLGLIVGRELRNRYKFTRQTPYDFYSHAGDKTLSDEYTVGV